MVLPNTDHFNKLKIMSEVSHENWKKVKTIYRKIKLIFFYHLFYNKKNFQFLTVKFHMAILFKLQTKNRSKNKSEIKMHNIFTFFFIC
jgi:hypothetical protein